MKVMMIYNPVAGQRDARDDVERAVEFLRAHQWEVMLKTTIGPSDATTYAREAVALGYDMVVAVGGDGTLGEVTTGLAGTDCPLGVLPVGTGNVWAHMLGLPVWTPLNRDALQQAAQVLLDGEQHLIDLGQAAGRYFLLWTGVGLDAQVAGEVEPYREVRRSLGNLTYLVSAVVLALNLRGTRMTVVIDGRAMRLRAIMVLVSNIQLYGPSWKVAPQAQLDDGWLDVYVFRGRGLFDVLRLVGMILLGRHQSDPKIESFRARRVEIRADKALPFHLDGDPAGHTPVQIEVKPRALRVIVPRWASGTLFEGCAAQPTAPSLTARMVEHLRHEQRRLRADLGRRLGWPEEEPSADSESSERGE